MSSDSADTDKIYDDFENLKNKINLIQDVANAITKPPLPIQKIFDDISEISNLMDNLDKKYGPLIRLFGSNKE